MRLALVVSYAALMTVYGNLQLRVDRTVRNLVFEGNSRSIMHELLPIDILVWH